MTKRGDGRSWGKVALAAALISPALALGTAVAIRLVAAPRDDIVHLLVMTVGRYVAYAAVVVAVLALVHAFGNIRRRGFFALLAMLVAGGAAGLYGLQGRVLAGHPPADVSTHPTEPPAASAAPATSSACAGLTPIPSQLSAEQVADDMQEAGFTVVHAGVFDIQGSRQAFWFQEVHDASVRIRPGRTDIRVIGRDPGYDGGAACRLALRLRSTLQAGR